MKKGFTIIETIIYIGLFTMLITGALVSIYALFEANARNQTGAMVLQEGNFILGKIDWALSGAESFAVSEDGRTLTIEKLNPPIDNPIVIALVGEKFYIKRGERESQILNNENVRISCNHPAGCFKNADKLVEIKFMISSQNFSRVKYLIK